MNNPYLVLRLNSMITEGSMPSGLPERYRSGEKLDDTDRAYINGVLNADYMGVAEFEFGAIGRALRKVSKNAAEFVNFSLTVTGKPAIRVADFRSEKAQESTVTLHGFCLAEDVAEVEAMVRRMATDSDAYHTKERPRLAESLFGEYRPDYYGANGKRRRKPITTLQVAEHIAWFDIDALWFVSKSFEHATRTREFLGLPAVEEHAVAA